MRTRTNAQNLVWIITLLSLAFIVSLASQADAQAVGSPPDENVVVVDIPDRNLEAAIRDALGIGNWKPLTNVDLASLTSLNAQNAGIVDLTGLEYCVKLTFLWLQSNNISDISPLAGLTNLQNLALGNPNCFRGNNHISDLGPLAGLTNLGNLDLFCNNISDLSPLAGLTNLRSLHLGANNISDISPLAGLTNLWHLNVSYNNLGHIPPLSGLPSLRILDLWDCNLTDISGLAVLANLGNLSLAYNNISDVSPLVGLRNLWYLNLYSNNISDVSPLAGLKNLWSLNLHVNNISDIGPLAGLTNLSSLGLGHNSISDISPLVGLTNLWSLNLWSNPLNCDAYLTVIPWLREHGIAWGELSYDPMPPGCVVEVSTLLATNVTKSSATLNGILTDDGGEACQYRFRYMEAEGSYIYTPWSGSVTIGQSFSETVNGLEHSKTYYFNAQAKNSTNESEWGDEQSFSTVLLPVFSTLPASNVTKSSATLNGILTDDGAEACQYRFRYKEAGGNYINTPWSGSLTTGQSFSETISKLRHNKTYYFNAQAKNSVGESAWGDEQSFSTKQFMITFDDGPLPGATESIIEGLNDIILDDGKPVRAGFFMVGCNDGCEGTGAPKRWYGWLMPFDQWTTKGSVHDYASTVRAVALMPADHIIGNHTQHHMWFWWWLVRPKDVEDEIAACHKELTDVLAQVSKSPSMIFRPPYFVFNSAVDEGASDYQIIMGAGDERNEAVDASGVSSVEDIVEKAANQILKWERDEPCVLVFHDASPITPYNIKQIIETLRQRFALVHFDPTEISEPRREEGTRELWGFSSGPVDLEIVAPNGSRLSKETSEIPDAFYLELGMSDMDDCFVIAYPEFYEIYVIPESGASPKDNYHLEIYHGEELLFSENQAKVGEISSEPYMFPVP